jgi:hypothetical protein
MPDDDPDAMKITEGYDLFRYAGGSVDFERPVALEAQGTTLFEWRRSMTTAEKEADLQALNELQAKLGGTSLGKQVDAYIAGLDDFFRDAFAYSQYVAGPRLTWRQFAGRG